MVTARKLVTEFIFKVNKSKLKEINNSILQIKKALRAVGAIAAFEVGRRVSRAFTGMIDDTTRATVRVDALSKKIGVTTGFVQALQLTSQKMGVSITRSVRAIERFNQRIDETRRGSRKSARAFGLLEVQLSNVNGNLKTNEQLFFETAAAIASESNHARRAALSMEVFGESGAELIPLLLVMGQDFEETRKIIKAYGAELTEAQILQDTKFQKSLVDIQIIFQGIRRIIADAVVPEFQKFLNRIKSFFLINKQIIRQSVGTFFRLLGKVFKETGGFIVDLVEDVGILLRAFKESSTVTKVFASAMLLLLGAGPLKGIFLGIFGALKPILRILLPLSVGLIILDDIIRGLAGQDSVTRDFINLLGDLDESLKGTTENAGALVKTLQALVGLKQLIMGGVSILAGVFRTPITGETEDAVTNRFLELSAQEAREGMRKIGAAFGADVGGDNPFAGRPGEQREAVMGAFRRFGAPQSIGQPAAAAQAPSVVNNIQVDTRVGTVMTTVDELTNKLEESVERAFKNSGVSLTFQGGQ